MDDTNYTVPARLANITRLLVLVGIVTIGFGFYFDTDRTWANLLLNNYYFTSLAIGAMFFLPES